MHGHRLITTAALLFVLALIAQCASKPAPPPPPELTPIVSVEELMENIVEPTADVIFDSVVTTVTASGTVEVKPTTEEDWLKVQRAALLLAETTNLLKMQRQIAPPAAAPAGVGPELSPAQMQAKVDGDRAQWGTYADALRDVAIRGIAVAKAKNVEGVFQLGSELDTACENCHLEYWYPGDKKKVQK